MLTDNRWRAPATASYTGATCAAVVNLVRQLHSAPQWHGPITALLIEKLQLAAQMVTIINGHSINYLNTLLIEDLNRSLTY